MREGSWLHKIQTFRRMRKLLRNWPSFICHLNRNRTMRVPTTVELRNRLKFVIRPWTNDFMVLNEVIGDQVYTRRDWELPPTPTIVDVGAYIGDFSVFAKYLWPDARIYAFEPHPDNFRLLIDNLQLNGYTATVVQAAVAAQKGTRTLVSDGTLNYGKYSLLRTGPAAVESRAVMLQDVVRAPIDLLKIDCEGGEYEILESLVSTGYIRQVMGIAMEWHRVPGRNGPIEVTRMLDGFSVSAVEANKDGSTGTLYAWR